MPVTRTEILKLYKQLITYSKTLTLTDPAYFRRRVATEFRKNKALTKPKDITFAYEVNIHHNICKLLIAHLVLDINCKTIV